MKKKMKAVIVTKYGSPKNLRLEEIDVPVPKPDEVLIKNYGSSLNTVDMITRGGKAPKGTYKPLSPFIGLAMRISLGGLRRPNKKKRIVGGGFVGEIVSVGEDVQDWKVGDHVYGYSENNGACAEYLAVPAPIVAKKPSNLNFTEAAAIPGGATPALLPFRDLTESDKGLKILIIGASGGIGTFAVQIAKNVYECEVTGVCGPSNIDMVKAIGADFVLDYTNPDDDYTQGTKKYDIIFDIVSGTHFSRCKNLLTETGFFFANNPIHSPKYFIQMGSEKFMAGEADEGAENMELLRQWTEEGKIKPVIGSVYPLRETNKAHEEYESGHARGRIVISIEHKTDIGE